MNSYTYKGDNLDEMDKFLERNKLPKLTQKEIENLNGSIKSKETEYIMIEIHTKWKQINRTESYYEWILPNT